MIYIGVDPGAKGGYAIIAESETGSGVYSYPWDNNFFAMEMTSIMSKKSDGIMAAVEKVGAMPGQGVTSMFNFGKSAGFIEGVLTGLGIPYQLVAPKRWKAEFGLNSDKEKSIEVCKRLFPNLSLLPSERCRKESDGMAEAALLACFAMRHFSEGYTK